MEKRWIWLIAILILDCASTAKYQLWKAETTSPEFTNNNNIEVYVQPIWDNSGENQLLLVGIKIWNKTDDTTQIEDLTLKDREEFLLFPLSPEEVAYTYLGNPPADFPILPNRPTHKRFIVTGDVSEFGYNRYQANLQIEERDAGGSILDGYLRAQALGRATYVNNFQNTVRSVIQNSFRTDIVPPHTQIVGYVHYSNNPLRCPLNLEIRLKTSTETFYRNYKIYPAPTKK